MCVMRGNDVGVFRRGEDVVRTDEPDDVRPRAQDIVIVHRLLFLPDAFEDAVYPFTGEVLFFGGAKQAQRVVGGGGVAQAGGVDTGGFAECGKFRFLFGGEEGAFGIAAAPVGMDLPAVPFDIDIDAVAAQLSEVAPSGVAIGADKVKVNANVLHDESFLRVCAGR